MEITCKRQRLTKQREIILRELKKTDTHPTADELYERVRKKLPKISMGTVYRNLEVLSNSGLIMKLEIPGSPNRFDGNSSPHHHVRCIKCGRVGDVRNLPSLPDISETAQSDFEILGVETEFYGLCPKCRGEP